MQAYFKTAQHKGDVGITGKELDFAEPGAWGNDNLVDVVLR